MKYTEYFTKHVQVHINSFKINKDGLILVKAPEASYMHYISTETQLINGTSLNPVPTWRL